MIFRLFLLYVLLELHCGLFKENELLIDIT